MPIDQTASVDAKPCPRCGRPTVADGTFDTGAICWWEYDAAANEPNADRSECERLAAEQIARLRIAAKALADFARTAPGRLPSYVGEALAVIDPAGRRE